MQATRTSVRDALERRTSLKDELFSTHPSDDDEEEEEEEHEEDEQLEAPNPSRATASHGEDSKSIDDGDISAESPGASEEGEEESRTVDEAEESEEESSFLDDEEIEAGSQGSSNHEELENRDAILAWWCERQLARTLRRVVKMPKAGPFREPLPWKELELFDYPEVITDPIDLRTIGERLEAGDYKDEEGFVNPEFFWQDVHGCWENCKCYYEDDFGLEIVQNAEEMRVESEKLEEEFWNDLDLFEQSLDRVGGNTLSTVAAYADVTKVAMQDAARRAFQESAQLMQSAANWLSRFRGQQAAEQVASPQKDVNVLHLVAKPRLRDHFIELLWLRFRVEGREDIQGIEEEVMSGMAESWPHLEEESDLIDYLPNESQRFASEKVPVERLLPKKYLASVTGRRYRRSHADLRSSQSVNSSSRTSVRSLRSTMSRYSQYSRLAPGSLSGSRSGSRRSSFRGSLHPDSRAGSPARSEASAGRQTPRSYRSEGSISAYSDGTGGSRAMARAVRQSLEATGASKVPGVESSSESDGEGGSEAAPSVDALRDLMPRRGTRSNATSRATSVATSRASTPGAG